MAIRSIAYVTLTSADTNYQLSTDTTKGNIKVINRSSVAAQANTAVVGVGAGSGLTAATAAPVPLGCAFPFPNEKPSNVYARCATAGQIVCVVIED